MPCYHPKKIKLIVNDYTGEAKWQFTHEFGGDANGITEKCVPCGNCIGCKLDYSRKWADRMMIELDHSKTAVFVTLTYDNEHCPMSGDGFYTLRKDDAQKFMKRIREYFEPKEIRFYLCGEYGTHGTHRPHYHAILFGLTLEDFKAVPTGHSIFGQIYYKSEILDRKWKFGFTSIAPCSWQTCAYVARYVSKKVNGIEWSDGKDIIPEFSLMSRRPGIGGYFAKEHPELLEKKEVYISDPDGLQSKNKVQMPHYLLEKLLEIDPEKYYSLLEQRRQYSKDRMLLELSKTDLGHEQYLEVKESKKIDSVRKLKRM